MGWSEKYKKSIDCNNPKGFSQKAHCAGKKKNEDMVFEEITEDILNEKLITYGNRKPYGQIVFMAGGAGSGKGFAIKNFVDSASFKIRDVDEMKKQLQILNRLGKLDIRSILKKYGRNIKLKDLDLIRKIEKDGYKLQNLNLKNPDHVYALHILVKAIGIKDSSLEKLLLGKNNPETLPNILFDITAKDVTDITSVIPKLKAVGYKPENVHLTWILTNYITALENNKNRSRMVPDGSMGSENIMLKTHEGASNTIWGLVTKALPKGMNGRVDVILNNPENTVFLKGADGKDLEKTQKDKSLGKGKDVKVKFTSGFLSLPLKKEKGGIYAEKVWKDKLFKWVKGNAPDSITANMEESVNEATFRPNSGTMSGGTYGLDNRKYELKRDVKGVKIGDYTNITLPKGTIIYNIPGGVFAHHRSLKSYESGQNKYFNKPTFRGISVRREKNTILSIEKNSKILESVNEAELKLGVKYINKQGKEGFIQTGGSKNSQDWFWFDGKVKHPYNKVKKELKPSKDQKKTGFSDYLKQGGRVWDNVNKDGESVNEATLSQIHKAAKKGSYPVSIVATMLGKVVKQELVKTPMAVPAAFMGMQGAYPKARISVESRTGQILFQEAKLNTMGEPIINEFLRPSDVDSLMKEKGIRKIPISSQGERLLKGMVKEKFLKKVTNVERLVYFYQSLGKEKFGYGVKGKPLSPLVSRFSNDLMSESITFGGKMAAYQVAMNIKDRLANEEEVDSTYYMLKDYFNSFGMDTNRSRVFKSANFYMDDWLNRNKKIAKQIGESVNEANNFAGWIAIDHRGKKIEIKKGEAKDLYNAKLLAIKKLKVPKSKVGMLTIKPAVDESINEISAIKGLKQVVKGNTKEVEGIKVSKEMAQAMIDWFNSSPYGRKYPRAKNARLHISIGVMLSFGLDRYAKHKGAKEELKYLKSMKESVTEGYGEFIKAKNLTDIVALSKKKKNAVFYVTDDNNSRIGTFYLKNGKFAKATSANPNYDLQRNKTKLKDRSDVIYKYKVDESVNEAVITYGIEYKSSKNDRKFKKASLTKTTHNPNIDKMMIKAISKDAKSLAKQDGWVDYRITKDGVPVKESVNEGKKRYYQKDGIGKSKYTISYHDGKKKHKDGSDFFDIQIFRNKKDLAKFVNSLHKGGYVYGFGESVNESVASLIDQIKQDSKDVKDFVKNIFKDSEFKKMSNDKDFIKYLKSIYEGINENDNVITIEERANLFFEENVPTDAGKWSYYKSQAKKKFDVYPSAYANGWAAKKYKAAGGGWKKKK